MDRLFADTYAIIEILKGNENYRRYRDIKLITTDFNILELSYALIRYYSKSKALEIISDVRDNIEVTDVNDSDFVESSEFRIKSNREGKKLSLIDCLGYIVAKRLKIKFLTGDKEFRDLEGVEFVK